MLDVVNQELGAREACAVKTAEDGKNSSDNYERFPYTGSSLHINSQYCIRGQKFANIKCVFCGQGYWSDKCCLITDPKARKKFFKENIFCFLCLKSSHVSRNCSKKKTCYYCKGMHNSAVCENKSKQGKAKCETSDSDIKNETGEITTNCSSNLASILLQTAEIILENPFNRKEVRVNALLDQGSQRSYLSQRIKSVLDLAPISKENISISTFGNPNSKQSTLEKVCFNLKNESEQTFPTEALSTPFICLPVKNQLR